MLSYLVVHGWFKEMFCYSLFIGIAKDFSINKGYNTESLCSKCDELSMFYFYFTLDTLSLVI